MMRLLDGLLGRRPAPVLSNDDLSVDSLTALDAATNFHNLLYIWGWFHRPDIVLESVSIEHPDIEYQRCEVNLPHGGVLALGPEKGFRIHAVRRSEHFPIGARLIFRCSDGKRVERDMDELIAERLAAPTTAALHQNFLDRIGEPGFARVLDIGGRDRSAVDRSLQFPDHDVTVIDIVPGDNVDLVGDAHDLSAHFAADSFDAIYSISVFEHLLMPWKVVLEMNRVLRTGGVAYIHTHQTLGMHDMPWDFWRFSDTSWDALFNSQTGFQIIGRAMAHEHFLLPFLWRPDKIDAEKSAGFESSGVYVEKTGESMLEWPVRLGDIVQTSYPSG